MFQPPTPKSGVAEDKSTLMQPYRETLHFRGHTKTKQMVRLMKVCDDPIQNLRSKTCRIMVAKSMVFEFNTLIVHFVSITARAVK